MRWKWLVWFFWGASLVCGCGGPGEGGSAAEEPTAIAQKAATLSLPWVRATVRPSAEPHWYRTQLTWETAGAVCEEIRVARFDEGGERVLARLTEANAFEDAPMKHQTVGYRVSCHNEGAPTELGHVQVTVPEDKQYAAGIHPWIPRAYGRVYFARGAVLRAPQGMTVQWSELHSEGATLETFGREEAAGADTRGASAGTLHLKVGKAWGPLAISVRGQAGGEGLRGGDGADGAPGRDAVQAVVALRDGFNALRDFGVASPQDVDRYGYEVKVNAMAATAGADGSAGEDGRRGAAGGDAGSVFLEVDEAPAFLPVVDCSGGEGGVGGAGGRGGAGGVGGKGAPSSPRGQLPELAGAGNGSAGKNGSPGPAGPAGQAGSARVVVAGRTLLDLKP